MRTSLLLLFLYNVGMAIAMIGLLRSESVDRVTERLVGSPFSPRERGIVTGLIVAQIVLFTLVLLAQ